MGNTHSSEPPRFLEDYVENNNCYTDNRSDLGVYTWCYTPPKNYRYYTEKPTQIPDSYYPQRERFWLEFGY